MVMDISFTGTNLLSVLLLFAAGLVFIIKGGDWFVDAATWIAEAFGIPKFIVGATVVSFATTPDRANRAIKFGIAMRPLNVSAISHTTSRDATAPITTTMMNTT